MTVRLLPDVEQLLTSFLRDQAEVEAFVDDAVFTVLPAVKRWPAVRVTRFGGLPVTNRPLWLDAPTVQIDAFGGPKKTAFNLAATCRAVMAERLVGVHDEGIVSNVRFGAFAYVPDTTFEPAQPRYLFTVTLFVHPNSEGGS